MEVLLSCLHNTGERLNPMVCYRYLRILISRDPSLPCGYICSFSSVTLLTCSRDFPYRICDVTGECRYSLKKKYMMPFICQRCSFPYGISRESPVGMALFLVSSPISVLHSHFFLHLQGSLKLWRSVNLCLRSARNLRWESQHVLVTWQHLRA